MLSPFARDLFEAIEPGKRLEPVAVHLIRVYPALGSIASDA